MEEKFYTEAVSEAPLNKVKKRKRGKMIILVIIVALLLLSAWRIVESLGNRDAVEEKALANVSVQTVEYGDIAIDSPLSGKIEPNEQVSLIPMIAGEVEQLNVSVGDYVTKGKVLFKIDTTQANLSYKQALASYELTVVGVNTAKTNYERMQSLYEQGVISRADYEAVEAQYENAVLSLAQVKAVLDSASEALKNATVTAPISGYITAVNIVKGALATQSIPAVTISDTSILKINTTVSEYLISKISKGDKVEVYIKALSNQPFEGTITTLVPTPSTGTLTYPITVTLNEVDSQVMSGMFAEIRITSDLRENVIAIPSEAILIKSGRLIAVVLENDVPVYREVEVGLDNGTQVEIISGLQPGDQLVVKGQNYAIEGEKVNIVAPAAEVEE